MIKRSLLTIVACMNVSMVYPMGPNRVHGQEAISTPLEKGYENALKQVGWDVPCTERALVYAQFEDDIIRIIDSDIAECNEGKDYVSSLYGYVDNVKREKVIQAALKVFRTHDKGGDLIIALPGQVTIKNALSDAGCANIIVGIEGALARETLAKKKLIGLVHTWADDVSKRRRGMFSDITEEERNKILEVLFSLNLNKQQNKQQARL